MSAAARAVIAWCLVLAVSGCAAWPRSLGGRPCCVDTKLRVHRQPIAWHLFDVTVLEPIEQLFHLGRISRKLLGLPIRALNLRDGGVGDSAFFTNRDPVELSPEDVRWGPSDPEDAPDAPLTITKPKIEGKTAGFFVMDAKGRRYLFKLDPADSPELLSGAEVVTSKLLYALGYHVPSYEVVSFDPAQLRVGDGVQVRGADGEMHPFDAGGLTALMTPRLRSGQVRAVASRILDGEILGPARFKRFRDCADVRALRVAYAWLNNIDAKDHNSLLVWDGTKTVGYLIDFGTSLGADAGLGGPKQSCAGWTYVVDFKEASLELLTLGRHRPVCDAAHGAVSSAVGLFSSHVEPDHWKPYVPNRAFTAMTDDDAEWIARRMSRLSREHIAAAVSAAQYSRPEDAAYLVEALDARRTAIVHHYLDDEVAEARAR